MRSYAPAASIAPAAPATPAQWSCAGRSRHRPATRLWSTGSTYGAATEANLTSREFFGSAEIRPALGWPRNKQYTVNRGKHRAHRRDRRRSWRTLFRLSLEKAPSRGADRPVRTERRRRHLGFGVVFS